MKTGGGADNTQQSAADGMTESAPVLKLTNRKPDELFNAVEVYYQRKSLNPTVTDQDSGIIAATGHDDQLAGLFLDCSMLPQKQNIQEHYRIVTQIWPLRKGAISLSLSQASPALRHPMATIK